MKKLTLTISALTLLALAAGVWWFVRGGDKEGASRNVAAEVTEVREDAVVPAQDMVQEKAEDTKGAKEVTASAQKEMPSGKDTPRDAASSISDIDTSNWKEYCNEEYGFCVKIPESFALDKKFISSTNDEKLSILYAYFRNQDNITLGIETPVYGSGLPRNSYEYVKELQLKSDVFVKEYASQKHTLLVYTMRHPISMNISISFPKEHYNPSISQLFLRTINSLRIYKGSVP